MSHTPQAIYFPGPADTTLFGWYHESQGNRSRPTTGVVICNPFGFEEISGHRSIRHFAIRLAGLGLPTLRFDYAACGDSTGDGDDSNLIPAWVGSIGHAIDELETLGSLGRVIVVGFGLGATLAALAIGPRNDVVGLVAIAPVVRGRRYLRELSMLGRASGQWPAPESVSESFLESGGFVLTRATTEAIGRIDLAASNVCAPPRVMIVEDQGIGRGETEWVDGLHEADVEVIHEVWPGYGAMTSDPQLAKAPLALFERAAAVMGSWADLPPLDDVRSTALDLESRRRSKAGATNSNSVVIRVAGARLSNVRESIAVIPGGDVELFGILTEPEDTSSTRRPTVIMLNAGSVHHVGPNGLWVRLAREWAARGVSVLRFDLSGVGDSPPRSGADDNVPYSRFALADVESAIRFVRRGEDREIYALGLCSGGYHAFRAAVTGLPIRAAIMVNPLTYYWDAERDDELKPYELIELAEEYRHRLLRTTTWRRVFSGRIDFRLVARVVAQSAWSALRTRAHGVARGFGLSLERDLVADIDRAIQHGIDLRFIFAEGSPGYRLLERQTGRKLRAFEASGRLSIGTVPNADHTFTATVPRERLVERLNGLLEI